MTQVVERSGHTPSGLLRASVTWDPYGARHVRAGRLYIQQYLEDTTNRQRRASREALGGAVGGLCREYRVEGLVDEPQRPSPSELGWARAPRPRTRCALEPLASCPFLGSIGACTAAHARGRGHGGLPFAPPHLGALLPPRRREVRGEGKR
eukprot:scaffold249547_cov32-Tisochrysis_lutea.AAC.1